MKKIQSTLNAFTRDEYFALEKSAEIKHEFFNGEIFAMSGGSFNHARISGNTFSAFNVKLRGKCCTPTNSDMRIETPNGLITYPDAAIFCGTPELTENQCALLNPVVIIEVLSPSTRRYDEGGKFTLYRSIPSFQDYLLIDSEKVFVQHFHKISHNEWLLHDYVDLSDSIVLNSIQETIHLHEIYDGIQYD
ncbi:MAG: Uma2 family endonuclease [Methylococcaceae bacterium]